MSEFHVIYLTGAPASGKSSIAAQLATVLHPLETWDYGEQLRKAIEGTSGKEVSYENLRAASGELSAGADIASLDEVMIRWVTETRTKAHVLIDSHAVTHESYGFRCTPCSEEQIRRLRPTHIFMLYVTPDVAVARINSDPQGRLPVNAFEAGFQAGLQASVAISYGIAVGVPVHFVDAAGPLESVVGNVVQRLSRG